MLPSQPLAQPTGRVSIHGPIGFAHRPEATLAEVAVHEARLDEIDVEGVVAFAEHVLANAAQLWLESSLDQRHVLRHGEAAQNGGRNDHLPASPYAWRSLPDWI
jgi:hypothetical protein